MRGGGGNANLEPMPFRRNFGGTGAAGSEPTDSGSGTTGSQTFGDLIGGQAAVSQRDFSTGACKKCGYVGHLTFQCRNFVKLKPQQDVMLDVSSTSTDSSDDQKQTPLVALEAKEKRLKRKRKHEKSEKKDRKRKRRKRDRSPSDSEGSRSDDSSKRRKSSRKQKKHKKKHGKERPSKKSSKSRRRSRTRSVSSESH